MIPTLEWGHGHGQAQVLPKNSIFTKNEPFQSELFFVGILHRIRAHPPFVILPKIRPGQVVSEKSRFFGSSEKTMDIHIPDQSLPRAAMTESSIPGNAKTTSAVYDRTILRSVPIMSS